MSEVRGGSQLSGSLNGADVVYQELMNDGFDEESAFWATAAAASIAMDSE